jgi:hypothetical protein
MATTYFDYLLKVRRLLKMAERSTKDDEIIPQALAYAAGAYSKLRPRYRVTSFAGDGATYSFTLPADYYEESHITRVEYPAGEQTPVYLTPRQYGVYRETNDALSLRLYTTPASAQTLRVTYTTPHLISEAACTIPEQHVEAVCQLAAWYVAASMAAQYAFETREGYAATTINYRTKSDEWKGIARLFEENYKQMMGMGRNDTVPAAAQIGSYDFDDQVFKER